MLAQKPRTSPSLAVAILTPWGDVITSINDIFFLINIYGNLDTEKSREHTISYISNKNEAKKIAERGFTKLLQYHTTAKRAEQFCQLVDEYL